MIASCKSRKRARSRIPKDLRDAYGIGAGTEVVFEAADDVIVVRKVASGPTRGRRLVEQLHGRGDVAMTTDEIIALTRS